MATSILGPLPLGGHSVARDARWTNPPRPARSNAVPDALALSASDLLLLERGDRVLLQRLLQTLFPMVHRWLYRTLAEKSSVDDALQETLIELAKSLPRFRAEAKLSTFAHRITMRVAYRYFERAKLARLEGLVEDALSTENSLEGQLLARSELTLIHRLLDSLSEGRRTAFLLCDVEGLSPAAAAELVGVPPLVLRSRLCRARADIKRLVRLHSESGLQQVESA